MKSSLPRVLFVEVSSNSKVGPLPVAGLEGTTCPSACPFKAMGCYSYYGPSKMHWDRLNSGAYTGITWDQFLLRIKALWKGQPWRYATFGDLPGKDNKIDAKALADLTAANRGKLGWAYSHKPVLDSQDKRNAKLNRKAIKSANTGGFTVNLSGNNVAHADKLRALNIGPVVTVVPENSPRGFRTPAGNKVVICPNQYNPRITCARCGVCQKQDRDCIVGFLPHGTGAKYVRAIAAAA